MHDAGFTPVPADVRLTVTGKLEKRNGHVVLVLDRMKEPRALTCSVAGPADELERALAQRPGQAVEIHGHWQVEGHGGILVEAIEDAPEVP
ncbi:MAG TPA: hypothetical protein VGR67_06355 [Candidatus Polarisedimenticolia bacterium]|nr:hypothetical protein [Candidatus Polarisedimenticolia bacterium]